MSNGLSAFAGFSPAAFAFFAGLREHNEPDWFKPRKAVYEAEVVAPFRSLLAALGEALAAAGVPLVGDPVRGLFRIYRDVRFSPDKRLYKTHQGAVLTRSGNKRDPGLLYLHLEPGEVDGQPVRSQKKIALGLKPPPPPQPEQQQPSQSGQSDDDNARHYIAV